jgi:uncharacterized protein (DUF1800 family)
MELHTLGVNGGYTQNDVRELARILTGWTVDPRSDSGFRFAPRLHDNGTKTLLGQRFEGTACRRRGRHPHAGAPPGHRPAHQPAPGAMVCGRPAATRAGAAPGAALHATQGDIAAVMRTTDRIARDLGERRQTVQNPAGLRLLGTGRHRAAPG